MGAGLGGVLLGEATGCGGTKQTPSGSGQNVQTFKGQAAVSHLTALVHAAPLHIAQQLGYYRDEHLEIEHVSFPGGTQTIRGMENAIGIGMPASLAVFIAYEKGRKDLRIVASMFNAASIDFITPTNSRIKSINDLRGAKVAVSSPGSNSDYFARTTVKKAGFTVGKDVEIVAVGEAPDAWTAASKSVVDVAWSASPLLDKLTLEGQARTVWRTRDYVSTWVDTCLAVRKEYLDANRDAIRRWIRAVGRAMDLINTNADQASAAYAKAVNITPEAAKAALTSWPKGTWDIHLNRAGFEANVAAGMEQGQIKTASPLDEIVVSDLVGS
jgi:NitT/TauT family transport system substrate-binding protein